MSNSAEVIIIGGGIIGNAAAYYLAQKGCSCIVLEKSNHIGNEGSSRNGGGVRQSGRDKREIPLARYGIQNIWPSLSEELGVNVEYHQAGNLRLGKTQGHIEILTKLTEDAVACGVDVRMISAKEIKEINPYLSEEVIGASWCLTDGHANPMMTTLGYYKRAREMGVRFVTGEEVTAIKTIKGRAAKLVTKNNTYYGQTILLAAGYASRKLAETVGIDLPMRPEFDEVLVTEAQPPMFDQMLGTAEADFYGHQSEHGSFVFGGSSGMEGFTKDNGMQATTSYTAPSICRAIMNYVPLLSKAKIVRTWAGCLDMSVDKVPVIGDVEEVPGLYLACMFTGHGFGIAPAVGKQLSEIIVNKKSSVDLSQLHYNRFAAKN